jgi:hypothetical protein
MCSGILPASVRVFVLLCQPFPSKLGDSVESFFEGSFHFVFLRRLGIFIDRIIPIGARVVNNYGHNVTTTTHQHPISHFID